MTGKLPKGADMLASIRRQGFRPAEAVFVFVDADRPRPTIYSDVPLTLEICIRPTDNIDDLDFWPLVDLDLTIHGGTALNDRLRSTLKAIVKARPRSLLGAVPAEKLLFAWQPKRGWEFEHVE
jgi:hypothetical protein